MGRDLILSFVFVALACGCEQRSIDMDVGESSQVLFSVDATKAESETTLELLKTQGFQTLLYKNGSEKLRDETVSWSDGYFRFAEETLWPGDGESLSAYACASPAPYVHLEEMEGKPVLKLFSDTSIWENSCDLCLAKAENISGGGTINLSFRHILGKISGIYAKTTYPQEEKVWLQSVCFREAMRPRYDIANALWSSSGEFRQKEIGTKNIYHLEYEYIPVQNYNSTLYLTPGKKTITLKYQIFNTTTIKFSRYSKTVSFEVLPGHDYNLQINISEDFVSLNCISSKTEEWMDGGEISGTGL